MNNDISPQAGGLPPAFQCQTEPTRRILVVEDDDVLRRVTSEVLIDSGYEVDVADNGAVAWSALQLFDYGLLITDNNLSHVTGVELLKKLYAAHMALPVIMATRSLPTREFVRRPWLTPQATLERPFSNAELLASVKNILHEAATLPQCCQSI